MLGIDEASVSPRGGGGRGPDGTPTARGAASWCYEDGELEGDLVAATQSFDVTSGVDLQEVDNAVNQAKKEIGQRYDFKGQKAEVEYDRKAGLLKLTASDEYYLNAMWQVIRERMISRKVPVKNLERGKVEQASGGTVRQEVKLRQGIPPETCRAIVKLIKDQKLKKVQAQVQGDAVRVSSPSRDELQQVIALLRQQDYEVELQFGNYRG